ncbi:MAG TPA: hypothetical protein VFV38_17525 [Ktedonobacteraceae bacterium]|nr:hypothetical protein [Ktedonobacteraceae bacterium]
MNQSASNDPLVSPLSRCAFHRAEITFAVVLLVSVFLIKPDDLLASASFPASSWLWLLFLLAMIIPARRWHGRSGACSPCDPMGESDPTHALTGCANGQPVSASWPHIQQERGES